MVDADFEVLRDITDELMFEIRDLTGQEYRNVHAGKTAETEPTTVAKVAHVDDRVQGREAAMAGGGE